MNILSLEFLDKIISILKANKNKLTSHQINVLFITDEFYSLYKEDFKIDNYLPILIKDGYVKELSEIDSFSNSKVKYYSLTDEGLSFIGYVDTNYAKLSNEQENKLLRLSQIKLNKSTILTNKLLIIFNGLIAVGAIVASVYYI